jgi:hypothetical protein
MAYEAMEDVYESFSQWLWGLTPREKSREAQKQVRQAQREVDKERWMLKQRHEKCESELRAKAKVATSMDDLRPIASEISRIKGALANVDRITRLLDGVATKMLSASTSVLVTSVLQTVTETLSSIRSRLSIASVWCAPCSSQSSSLELCCFHAASMRAPRQSSRTAAGGGPVVQRGTRAMGAFANRVLYTVQGGRGSSSACVRTPDALSAHARPIINP